jgi:predicted TIM-barrel fold metal-dependent hydrolase
LRSSVHPGIAAVISSNGAVDAHHLWNPSDPGQGWLADPALAPIRRRFDLQDLHDAVRAGVAGRPVTATVLVQSVARTDETERLLATAADDDPVAAVVGWIDLTGDVPTRGRPLSPSSSHPCHVTRRTQC